MALLPFLGGTTRVSRFVPRPQGGAFVVTQDIIPHRPIENVRRRPEGDEPGEPLDAREELDDVLELTGETNDGTPEEAGYGHGV